LPQRTGRPLKSTVLLGRVQGRVVRNLEDGFALEFLHSQPIETLEESGYRAVKRDDAKTPVFFSLKAASRDADAAFFSCVVTGLTRVNARPVRMRNSSSASVPALILTI